MLTALHITLPQRQRDDRSHPKHLPNRCLVVNEATCEASLISTEASLKYAAGNTDTHDSRESGTRFRFGHLAISPHHGSIFVTQVAPLLYDLCCKFFSTLQSSNSKTSAGSTVFPMTGGKTTAAATQGGGGGIYSHAHYIPQTEWEKNTSANALSRRGAYESTYSMNRTIFIYGSHSATERRALFLHLAKATSLALLKETTNMSTQAQRETPRCDVSFSLVDVYHAWGVGDVLDVSAAMHDRSQLERLRRSQPRRSINEPKGIFFVEPTRQRLESRDDGGRGAPAAILRALQRSDPPRGLHTRAERDDHAARSTLVLTFILSRRGDNYNCGESDRKRKGGGKQTATAPEARVHLILLADSAAAAHGKEKAQELAALAGVLQACTQWRREWISSPSSMPPTDNNKHNNNNNTNTTEDNYVQPPDSGNVRKGRQMNVSSSSSARSKSPKLPWVPLRESPVLMYLFESTRYYTHHAEQSLHNLRQSKERRRLFGDKSGVMNGNISSSSCNAAKNTSLSTTSLSEENNEYGGMGLDANNSNVLDCIAAGIGPCLLVVCVNSGWDQYYQARSAFLFVRRATNQNEVTMAHNNDNNNNNNNNKSLDFKVVEMSHHVVQSDKRNNAHTVSSLPGTFIQSPCNRYQFVDEGEGRREGEGVAESIILPLENTPSGVSRQLWSSPRQRETTEPRPQRHHHHHLEDSPVSHATLSDVPIICDQESDGYNNEGEGKDLSSHTSSQMMENINNNNNNINNSVHQHSETSREHSASEAKNNPAFEASPQRNNSPPRPVQELFQCRQGHQCEEKSDYNDDNNNNKNKSKEKKNDTHGDVDMDNETDSKSWEQPETTRNSQIAPVAFGLCASPSASYSTTTKGVNVDSSSPVADTNHLLRDVLQRQSSLMKENEQLRALLVNLSSQQAERNTREQRRATGIIDVCDVGMLVSRGAASASELNKLRGELASTTKKARVLQRTLSRSLDENRKLRRVVHQEMRQCLVDVSRTFRDTMAERKTTSPVFTEERVNRWENMLKDTLNHLLQSERDEDAADNNNNNNNNNREKDEGLFAVAQECDNGGSFGSQQKSQGNQCMKKSLINSVCTTYTQQELQKQPLESCCNESHKTVQIEAEALPDEAEGTGRRACRRGIKFDDKLKSSVDKPSLNSQVVQLLQIAHRLFLCEPSCSSSSYDNADDDNWTVDEAPRKVGGGVSDKTHLGSLSQSILEILSPRRHDSPVKNEARDREEERLLRKQKLKRDVCWKCHAESLHTRQSAEYIKFLETLRSLCRQVLVGGCTTTLLLSSSASSCAHPQEEEEDVNEKTGTQASMHPAGRRGASPTTTTTKTIIKEATGTTGGLLGDEGSVLLKARQLSNSLHHRTAAREAERTALQQMQSALEREREWRRQLQDELLSLRHHLSKYESRINFIDETVKPKLSNDIAQLEQRISDRKKQHGLERERQRIFMSEIQKRLQRIISESEVNTFPSSSSTTSFLFSPQEVSAKSMR